jgi:hypothetical protein
MTWEASHPMPNSTSARPPYPIRPCPPRLLVLDRPDRQRQDGDRPGIGRTARCRDRLPGFDDPVPRDGHRHGQADDRSAAASAPPSDRYPCTGRGVQSVQLRGRRQGRHRRIRSRGREVLFVGGTPLYLKALLRGIFQGPPADWEFRQQIEEELLSAGLPALHSDCSRSIPCRRRNCIRTTNAASSARWKSTV